jgi:hypothetical protein
MAGFVFADIHSDNEYKFSELAEISSLIGTKRYYLLSANARRL